MKKPNQHMISSNNLNLCVFEWEGKGPPVVFVHASGFHARCFDKVIRLLGDRHVLAIDLMGHGRSENPPLPLTWKQYSQNVIDVIEAFDLRDVVAVGHSLGGYCVVEAAGKVPDRIARLILLDPVIFDQEHANLLSQFEPEQLPVARRRSRFSSPNEMKEWLSGKGSFDLWDPEVLRDYCEYGLLPAKDGFELACPPITEAATYVTSGSQSIYKEISKVKVPVLVVRARDRFEDESEFSFGYSPTNPELAGLFPQGVDLKLEECSHFIPMEKPEFVAELIA